jgi:hypothetical protein
MTTLSLQERLSSLSQNVIYTPTEPILYTAAAVVGELLVVGPWKFRHD